MVNKSQVICNRRLNPVAKTVNACLHGCISYFNHAYYTITSCGLQSIIPMFANMLACYMEKKPDFTELPGNNMKKTAKTAHFYMFGVMFS